MKIGLVRMLVVMGLMAALTACGGGGGGTSTPSGGTTTYTLSYDANGATSGTVPASASYAESDTVSVSGNTGNLARAGYSFVGWNSAANGSGTDYAANTTFSMAAADLTLYAQWTADPTYSVTYDANGATSGSAPGSASYLESATVTVASNSGGLALGGFTFSGWNTAANGSGTSYAPGATFSMGAAAVTLYAQWTALPTYSVSYNANGATSGSVPGSSSYLEGATVTVASNSGTLALGGFTFSGWNTAANGSGTSYAPGATFTMGTSAVTLYAQWAVLPTYSVSYNANGATSGSVPGSSSYLQGATVTVASNSGGLALSGYIFNGWNTQPDGSGTSYSPSSQFVIGAANITLYAEWAVDLIHTVTYVGNGSDGGSVPVDSTNYETGQFVTVLGNTNNLVRAGYQFVGWSVVPDGLGDSYAQGDQFIMGATDVTLYAKWSLGSSAELITYHGNGNDGGSVPVDTTHYANYAMTTVMENTNNLTRAGYSFAGWRTTPTLLLTTKGYYPALPYMREGILINLHAVWTTSPTYSVIYDGNGNTSGSVPVDTSNYEEKLWITVRGNPNNLARTGYSFAGWNTQPDGSGEHYSQGSTFFMAAADVTLYAQWSADPTYHIIYDGNGNDGGNPPLDTTGYAAGATAIIQGNFHNLTNGALKFNGWNTLPDGTGITYTQASSINFAAEDITLYARWTSNPTYKVIYLGSSSMAGGAAPYDTTNYEVGQSITVLGNIGNLVEDNGSFFYAWKDSSLQYRSAGDILTMGTTNIMLSVSMVYPTTISVIYDGNGNDGGVVPAPPTDYFINTILRPAENTGSLTKSGYVFDGWNTTPDGSGYFYEPGGGVLVSGYLPGVSPYTNSLTLYAQWGYGASNIFYNAGIHTGNMGGVSGANALCAASKPGVCGSRNKVVALLSKVDSSQPFLDIPALYNLNGTIPIIGPTGVRISADWAGLDGSIDVSLADAGVLPANTRWWSGAWASSSGSLLDRGPSCYARTSPYTDWMNGASDGTGVAGMSSTAAAPDWIDQHTINSSGNSIFPKCNNQYYLLCVCGE